MVIKRGTARTRGGFRRLVGHRHPVTVCARVKTKHSRKGACTSRSHHEGICKRLDTVIVLCQRLHVSVVTIVIPPNDSESDAKRRVWGHGTMAIVWTDLGNAPVVLLPLVGLRVSDVIQKLSVRRRSKHRVQLSLGCQL